MRAHRKKGNPALTQSTRKTYSTKTSKKSRHPRPPSQQAALKANLKKYKNSMMRPRSNKTKCTSTRRPRGRKITSTRVHPSRIPALRKRKRLRKRRSCLRVLMNIPLGSDRIRTPRSQISWIGESSPPRIRHRSSHSAPNKLFILRIAAKSRARRRRTNSISPKWKKSRTK